MQKVALKPAKRWALTACLADTHTCWQKPKFVWFILQIKLSAISACLQGGESMACHLSWEISYFLRNIVYTFWSVKISWNVFTFLFPSPLSCPGESVSSWELKGKLASMNRVFLSWNSQPQQTFDWFAGCLLLVFQLCYTCGYLHLNSIFTSPCSLAFSFTPAIHLPPHQSFWKHSWAYLVSTEL